MNLKTLSLLVVCLVPLALGGAFLVSDASWERQLEGAGDREASAKETAPEAEDEGITIHSKREAALSQLPPVESTPDTGNVVFIGDQRDPDDPDSWRDTQNDTTVLIGEYRDADDPDSWPNLREDVVVIGTHRDPDDPTSWPQTGDDQRVLIGEHRDPEAPQSWSTGTSGTIRIIGEHRDPDIIDSLQSVYDYDE